MIIGALGALTDVTISQSSTCEQIYDLNPQLKLREIYQRFNEDGKDDLAISLPEEGEVLILLGSGDGNFLKAGLYVI